MSKRQLIHKVIWRKPIQKSWLNTTARAVETLVTPRAVAIRAVLAFIERVFPRADAHCACNGGLPTALDAFLYIRTILCALALIFSPGDEADAATEAE